MGQTDIATELRFDASWAGLYWNGECDAAGGAEYRRVWAEYLKAGCPDGAAAFIRRATNGGAG